MIKVLHYLNQFFAGIGGEEKAGQEVLFMPGAVGAGSVIENALKAHGVEYATIVCGDNYFHEAGSQRRCARLARHSMNFTRTYFLPARPSTPAGMVWPAPRSAVGCATTGAYRRSPACTKTIREPKRSAGMSSSCKPAPPTASMAETFETLFAADRTAAGARRSCGGKFPRRVLFADPTTVYGQNRHAGLCPRRGSAAGQAQRPTLRERDSAHRNRSSMRFPI